MYRVQRPFLPFDVSYIDRQMYGEISIHQIRIYHETSSGQHIVPQSTGTTRPLSMERTGSEYRVQGVLINKGIKRRLENRLLIPIAYKLHLKSTVYKREIIYWCSIRSSRLHELHKRLIALIIDLS